jgi:hypothetical protein
MINLGEKYSHTTGLGGFMILDLNKFKEYGVEVITLGLKCNQCGKTWGINLSNMKHKDEIPINRIVCEGCGNNKITIMK